MIPQSKYSILSMCVSQHSFSSPMECSMMNINHSFLFLLKKTEKVGKEIGLKLVIHILHTNTTSSLFTASVMPYDVDAFYHLAYCFGFRFTVN